MTSPIARKYLPFTLAKNMKYDYIKHMTADFETSMLPGEEDVHVWLWGLADIMSYEFEHGTDIGSFLDRLLNNKLSYDIAFHNLKYDGNYILPALYRLGYTYIPSSLFTKKWQAGEPMYKTFTHNITAQGQWFSLTIIKDCDSNKSTPAFVHFWDSLKLFPESLKKVGLQYNKTYQKIDEPSEFYTTLRERCHNPTSEELLYIRNDCLTLAEALRVQLDKYGTIYRTRASKAFSFFKDCCVSEDGETNIYMNRYEGLRQFKIPRFEGFEDWAGAFYRFAPKNVKQAIKKRGIELEKHFDYHIPDYKTWLDFKQAYRGGISYCNPDWQGKDVVSKVTVLDINSMYPYCMKTFDIPFGKPIKKKGKPVDEEHTTWIACARVSFRVKEPWYLPCIQIKEKYGREWLTESTDYKEYGEVDYYNEDVIWFTKVDYETYLETYEFTVHEWLGWYQFRQMGNADGKRFVEKYSAIKIQADQIMKQVKAEYQDDGYKEDDRYIKASLERQEAKIILNSAYGKHGTKYVLLSKKSIYIEGEPIKFEGETLEFNKEPDDPSHYYIPYACFVTSYARRMLSRAWNRFGGKALYCDTDSIHFMGTMDDIPGELAEDIDWLATGELGLWKKEGEFIAGRYLRSKTYIEIDTDDKAHITCAGATPEIKELMTWDTFRVGFNAWDICYARQLDHTHYCKLKPKQYPSGVQLEPQNFEIRPNK